MKEPQPLKTSEKILLSAEKLFAQYSYSEVSIRQITEDAGIQLALAHYHFGSKEALFRTLIGRRIGKLSQDREKLLKYYQNQYNHQPIPLEKLIEAFIGPYLYNTLYGSSGWRHYAKLVARLLSSGSKLALSILNEQFNPSAKLFLAELRRIFPTSTEEQVQWGFDFLVGSMCNTFAEVDRISELSENICSVEQTEQACCYLFNFATEGLRAVLLQPPFDYRNIFGIISEIE